MRSRYLAAAATVVTGGLRFGITIARAKRRAVSGSTALSASPSRRCRCQSSGWMSVISCIGKKWADETTCNYSPRPARALDLLWRLAFQLQRRRVDGIALGAGDLCRQRNSLFDWQLFQQYRQHFVNFHIIRIRFIGLPAFHNYHEFAALLIVIGFKPADRLARQAMVYGFKALGQFAAQHYTAVFPERRSNITHGLNDAVRRFIENHSLCAQCKAFQKRAPLASFAGQKSAKTERGLRNAARRQCCDQGARP